MNTNVSDMPLEIFGDYISDCLGIEFTWEYMFVATTIGYHASYDNFASGCHDQVFGIGDLYYYAARPPSLREQCYGGGLFVDRGYGLGVGGVNSSGSGNCINTGDSS